MSDKPLTYYGKLTLAHPIDLDDPDSIVAAAEGWKAIRDFAESKGFHIMEPPKATMKRVTTDELIQTEPKKSADK